MVVGRKHYPNCEFFFKDADGEGGERKRSSTLDFILRTRPRENTAEGDHGRGRSGHSLNSGLCSNTEVFI